MYLNTKNLMKYLIQFILVSLTRLCTFVKLCKKKKLVFFLKDLSIKKRFRKSLLIVECK